MPNQGNPWSDKERQALAEAYKTKPPWISVERDFAQQFGATVGRTEDSVRGQIDRYHRGGIVNKNHVPRSTYPIYDSPLEMEGVTVCIGDVEAPYHHAEFWNCMSHQAG